MDKFPFVKEKLRLSLKQFLEPAIHCECGITQVSLKGRGTGTVSGNINSFDKPKFKVAFILIIFCKPCKVKYSFNWIIDRICLNNLLFFEISVFFDVIYSKLLKKNWDIYQKKIEWILLAHLIFWL
uniref:hypothetical protein n=1 Tax=Exserohilum turcicum TaxID=93612 RepID=UPI002001A3C5|nr:hypothetical protein M1I11_mgp089 [Exserohilum turcicum]UOU81392.1 hypothetical protein [Exserohilum turcicum]